MKIEASILYLLLTGNEEIENFKVIEDEIISSDVEDGGADHVYILQDTKTGKFYSGDYCDWDLMNTDFDYDENICAGRIDLNTDLIEVKPVETKKIVYVPV